jgi:ubiquinone/menaquinone biosynthesis C-methylase UbiE
MMTVASAYDNAAPRFDRHRQLPDPVINEIRTTVLAAAGSARPRLLDLGAGTGRIGRTFVAAGDDYVGVDLSLGMLGEFARQFGQEKLMLALVCADGRWLPFRDEVFDAVMLIQVVGAAKSWRELVNEARRVLRPSGALIIGHAVFPPRRRGCQNEGALGSDPRRTGSWSVSHRYTRHRAALAGVGGRDECAYLRSRLDRTPDPAHVSRAPANGRPVFNTADIYPARGIAHAIWAAETFGSLDAIFEERHEFELKVFKF